jgi:hypothetical protein
MIFNHSRTCAQSRRSRAGTLLALDGPKKKYATIPQGAIG